MMQTKNDIAERVVEASRDTIRRAYEEYFDSAFELHLATHGAFAQTVLELLCGDDWIDEAAKYLHLAEPEHKTHKGAAWRETSGSEKGVRIRLSTAARRYLVPA